MLFWGGFASFFETRESEPVENVRISRFIVSFFETRESVSEEILYYLVRKDVLMGNVVKARYGVLEEEILVKLSIRKEKVDHTRFLVFSVWCPRNVTDSVCARCVMNGQSRPSINTW